MIVRATIQARDGRLFRPLLEWREDVKCYEVLTFAGEIGQRFLGPSALCEEPAIAPEFNT
jgi:hypothetical protein